MNVHEIKQDTLPNRVTDSTTFWGTHILRNKLVFYSLLRLIVVCSEEESHHFKVKQKVGSKHIIVSRNCKVLNVIILVNLYLLDKACSFFSNSDIKIRSLFL